MALDDVPSAEMPFRRSTPDPIDAALRGSPVDDPAVLALVHDLRAATLPTEARERSAALVAFAGPARVATDPASIARHDPPATSPSGSPSAATRPRRSVAVGLAAFVATLTGKLVLGGAVAAAALGGLHATEVVDVPLLPDVSRAPAVPAPAVVPDPAPSEPGIPGPFGPPPAVPPAAPGSPPAGPAADRTPSTPGVPPPTPAPTPRPDTPVGPPPTTGPPADPSAAPVDPSSSRQQPSVPAPEPAPADPGPAAGPGSATSGADADAPGAPSERDQGAASTDRP